MVKTLMSFKVIAPRSKNITSINTGNIQDALNHTEQLQEESNSIKNALKQESRNRKYRLGSLEVDPYRAGSSAEESLSKTPRVGTQMFTPACLNYCQAANLIPHLLPEVASTLKNTSYKTSMVPEDESLITCVEKIESESKKIRLDRVLGQQKLPEIHHTSIDHFINVPGYKKLDSFSQFTATENSLTLMDIHDPSLRYQARPESIKPWKSGKEFATLATTNGLFKISPSAYVDIISSFKMDMAVCLYDCMPNLATKASKTGLIKQMEFKLETPNQKRVAKSIERTSKWTEICTQSASISGTSLISAVIGGPYSDLRARSAQLALALGDKISGFLVANLHGGEKEKLEQLQQTLDALQIAPSYKPIFSWEFVTPREILHAVEKGVDIFDSTYPYLATEHGYALTFDCLGAAHFNPLAMINLNRPTSNHVSEFQDDTAPISESCSCYACSNRFSRAYIVHLLNTHEMLATILLMCHNFQVYLGFFESIRTSIYRGCFESNKDIFIEKYTNADWFEFLDAELTLPPNQRANSPTLE
ncbi:hypothetical protein DSO57_1017982 [Entomophthora muscae]|uniref:Uncharacterized protein n=1 Tax=Entomophthora muscae TaxID=34485 RepID=A0ACC2T4H5_9FUNG|nr:hypothetical protein DSO57_1017982 [Entomophthora muscae]